MSEFRYFLTFFVCFLSFFQESYAYEDDDTIFTLKTSISASKQDIHFRTPAANSILDWSADTVDYGFEAGIKISGNFAAIIEYEYSEVKAGNSTDDDIENGGNSFSWHGVGGRGNDGAIAITYKNIINNRLLLSPTVGMFYKQFKIHTEGGEGNYNGVIVDLSDLSPGNQTDTSYYGMFFGGKAEYDFSDNVTGSIRVEYMIPFEYKAQNIWYGRNPVLHWSLENSDDTGKGDRGVRVKLDFGFKRLGILSSVRIFGYYEFLGIDGLIENDPAITIITQNGVERGSVDGRNCNNCPSIGKSKFEAFGGGISIEF